MTTPNRPPSVDWQRTIKDIRASGLTFSAISEHVGCAVGTLGNLANGTSKDASHTVGDALLQLHKKVTKRRKVNR